MAATKGHGNPNWDRDEIVLALHLYETLNGVIPSKDDSNLEELSSLLRGLPHHEHQSKNATFRNTAGVRFKLQNIQYLVTGSGLDHSSELDKVVVKEFSGRSAELAKLAARITQAATELDPTDFYGDDGSEGDEFYEGRVVFTLHRKRERNRSLRQKLINRRRRDGLACDICGLSKPHLPAAIQEALFEIHHVIPLAEAEGQKITKLGDLALLCACCHRALHKIISQNGRWIDLEEGRSLLACE